MSTEQQFTTVQAAARAEIQHRILQFARGVDRRDLALARQAFHPDATDNHGAYDGPIDGLFEWIEDRHRLIAISHHQVGPAFIEFADEDNAFAETYVMTWQSVNPAASILEEPITDEFEMVNSGRYGDHFTRRDGAWRIQKRVTTSLSNFRVASAGLMYPSTWPQTTRDETDPVQALRASLGIISSRSSVPGSQRLS